MYTIVRSYFGKGSKELFDVVEKNKADVATFARRAMPSPLSAFRIFLRPQ
jgi:hypothetical protein